MTGIGKNLVEQWETCLIYQAQVYRTLQVPQEVLTSLDVSLPKLLSEAGEHLENLPYVRVGTHVNPEGMAYKAFHVPLLFGWVLAIRCTERRTTHGRRALRFAIRLKN